MFNRQSASSLAQRLAARSHSSPEFWLFNPPASPKDIRKLEAKIGWLLPEPLASTMLAFNGGFSSAEGKVSIECPMEIASAREKANRFLNTFEIESAYRALLGAHPDEDSSAFPFIPFLKLAEGGLLAVNSLDPTGAVWHAWTLDGPHLWRRLYPCFTELLWAYMQKDGAIQAVPYDDEPTATASAY